MRRIALALGLALALGACNSDATGPSGSVAGSYSLQRINGTLLPYTFPSGAVLVSETVTLRSDNTYTLTSDYSNATDYTENGQYSSTNGDVDFYANGSASYQGSVSGTVLTAFSNGYTSVYQKN